MLTKHDIIKANNKSVVTFIILENRKIPIPILHAHANKYFKSFIIYF